MHSTRTPQLALACLALASVAASASPAAAATRWITFDLDVDFVGADGATPDPAATFQVGDPLFFAVLATQDNPGEEITLGAWYLSLGGTTPWFASGSDGDGAAYDYGVLNEVGINYFTPAWYAYNGQPVYETHYDTVEPVICANSDATCGELHAITTSAFGLFNLASDWTASGTIEISFDSDAAGGMYVSAVGTAALADLNASLPIPAPAAAPLLGAGLLAMGALARRRRAA